MIPPSLFLACFVTLAANPALVHSIPLPPPTRAAAASHPQQHFAAPAPTSTLRIVDEDASHDTIPASWVHSNNVITPDTLFADSILPGGVEASLNAVLASMQVAEIEHVRRGLKHKGQGKRMKRSVTKKEKRKADKKKRNVRKEKRFSPRRAEQQQAASSRLGALAAATATSTAVASTSSLVWTKVTTTLALSASITSTAPVTAQTTASSSSAQPTTPTLSSSAQPTSAATPLLFTSSSSSSSSSFSSTASASSSSSTLPSSTTASSPLATETTSSGFSLGGNHSGDGTWFAPGLGACGTTATSNSSIVAVSHLLYDTFPGATANPNLNPICGQKILATYAGTSVEVTVQDRCEGCAMWDLDFSPSMFEQLADLDVGRLQGVQWTFL